ncbi:MAG: 2-methylcitrate dehydratase PrpD [Gammaproteobacteria bacterium]|jgi:2-methylcitrate dehydratase PrpD
MAHQPALTTIAKFISNQNNAPGSEALACSQQALIDTLACIFLGINSSVSETTVMAFENWGSGNAIVIGQQLSLAPPFAAMINAACSHAHDYDDFDAIANSHPSAVIFPALLAITNTDRHGLEDLLDAHIIGVEVIQRLGEAMNMEHYRKGWLTTTTLGTIAATAACSRLNRCDLETTLNSLSLACSMASGLTNQGGFNAKQLNPGIAAKNAVMATQLASSGIEANPSTLDGPISIANVMGVYEVEKFETALNKLGKPWSILEYGLIQKAYPSCGYTNRIIDAALELHSSHAPKIETIKEISVSIPDFYLDLLIYPDPANANEAMFSAEYSVATTLITGFFDQRSLDPKILFDEETRRLMSLIKVVPRIPRNRDLALDGDDPDMVRIEFITGDCINAEVSLPTGAPGKPMNAAARRQKFDQCLTDHRTTEEINRIWDLLNQNTGTADLEEILNAVV